MLEEAISIPNGLRVGPLYVNGAKMAGTGDQGTSLYLYPADDGVQHSEIVATRDSLDVIKPKILAKLLRNKTTHKKYVRYLRMQQSILPCFGASSLLACSSKAMVSDPIDPKLSGM